LVCFAPVPAAVLSDLNQAVVSADVNQSFFLWRFRQRRCVTEESRGSIPGDRVDALNFAHDRQLVAIQTARELPANHGPAIAAIVAAKEFVGGKVKPRVQVRTDDEDRKS